MIHKNQVLFLVFLLCIVACNSKSTSKFIVVDFISAVDQNFITNKPNFKDVFSIKVVDVNNIRTFVIPFHNARRKTTLLPNGEIKDQGITYDTTFVYCMLEKNSQIGLRYDSLRATNFQKFPVDSLLNRINIGNGHLKANSIVEGNLVYSLTDQKEGKLLVQKFVSKKKGTIDSTYRYYDSSLANLDFTLAPKIDERYHNKLVKIVNIHINEVKKIRNVYTTEIRPGTLKDPKSMKQLIEKFRKDIRLVKKLFNGT